MKKIKIKVSADLQGKLEGRLELKKGFLGKTFHTTNLGILKSGVNSFLLPKAEEIKSLKTDIRLVSQTNLRDNDSQAVHIEGTIRPGEGLKDADSGRCTSLGLCKDT